MKSPLGIIFLTIAIDLIGFGMVVPLLPLYAQQFGATGTQVAFLFASYSLMQFLFAPVWGRLSDRIGRRPVLLASIAGNVVALLCFGLAPTYAWLLAARLVAGLCTANISVANAYVADVTTPENRAKGMGLVGAAFGIGFVIGPFLGGELSAFGYRAPALVASGLGALNLLGAWLRLPESLPAARPRGPRPGLWRERLQVLGEAPQALPVLALGFLQILGFSMMEMSLVLFARDRLAFDAAASGRLFAYVGVVLVLVQGGLIGRLVRRWGEVRVARLGLLGLAVGLGLMPQVRAGAWPLLLALMTLLGAGQGMTSPALGSLLSRSVPAHRQGATLGVSQSLSALARVLGPQAAGLLYDHGGAAWPFWAGATIMGGALALAFAALRPASRRAAQG
jgi:DHA1 family tetracycline resistance protein-like MFS transporter